METEIDLNLVLDKGNFPFIHKFHVPNEVFLPKKITKYGETICEFSLPLKKQPFERLFIACPIDTDRSFEIPEEKFIFSIPSAIHSHKPPLDGKFSHNFLFIDLIFFKLKFSFQ